MTAGGAELAPETSTVVLVQPSRGWVGIDPRELWGYRELLYFLVWRDIKVRYKQTAFGVLWAILQPLLLVVVFSLVIGRVEGLGPTATPYPLFAFAGLVPWTLFAKGLGGAATSLVSATNLIQKVYFPRLLLPAAALGLPLLDFGIAMVAVLFVMGAFGVLPMLSVIWAVPLTALSLTIIFAGGVWLAAANVRYRDVQQLVPFLIQLGLFASPVIYSASVVPQEWLWLYHMNPVAGVIEGFRWALLGTPSPELPQALLSSLLVTGVILVSGLAYFRRTERTFADVI